MPTDDPDVRIELEVAVRDGEISGRLRAEPRPEWRPFAGWMDLAARLTDAVDRPGPDRPG